MLLLDVKEIDSQADPAVGAVCIAVPVRTGPGKYAQGAPDLGG